MTKKKDLSDAINKRLNETLNICVDWTFLRERDLRKMKKMLED